MEHKTFFHHNFLRNNYIKLGFACFLCYMGCYTGKTILSALSPLLRSQGVFTADQIGTMGSILFFSYGFGQLVNGTLGDHFSPKLMSFFGVTASGILVASLPFLPNFTLSHWLFALEKDQSAWVL